MTTHYRDKFLHPIYLWIRDFHFQFEAVVRASHRMKFWRNEIHPVFGYIFNLLGDVLSEVPKDQIIKQKKNILNVKKYKEVLYEWFRDWRRDDNHEQFPEVLCFSIYFLQ